MGAAPIFNNIFNEAIKNCNIFKDKTSLLWQGGGYAPKTLILDFPCSEGKFKPPFWETP
jgi:hypothetical protein